MQGLVFPQIQQELFTLSPKKLYLNVLQVPHKVTIPSEVFPPCLQVHL